MIPAVQDFMMGIGLLSTESICVIYMVLFGKVVSYKLENIALGKKAYQSSDWSAHSGLADKAVDGGLSHNFHDGSCTATQSERNAFWEVDLGKTFFIDHVTIYKRTDIDSIEERRLSDVELYIGVGTDSYTLVGYHEGIMESVYTFNLAQPVFGQWIRITRIPSVVNILELCEVQVYGYGTENYFKINHDRAGIDAFYLTSTSLPTVTHCAYMCYKSSGCEAANYDEDRKMCDLFTSSSYEEVAGRTMLIPYE